MVEVLVARVVTWEFLVGTNVTLKLGWAVGWQPLQQQFYPISVEKNNSRSSETLLLELQNRQKMLGKKIETHLHSSELIIGHHEQHRQKIERKSLHLISFLPTFLIKL